MKPTSGVKVCSFPAYRGLSVALFDYLRREKKETMNDIEELEFETPLEEEVESIRVPSDKRKIYTELGDPEIESLHGKFKRGKLIVQPDFQRQYVWDAAKASRLVESALLGIPIPMIYISQEQDNREYVIDGQQRLTSFFSFIDGKLPVNAH